MQPRLPFRASDDDGLRYRPEEYTRHLPGAWWAKPPRTIFKTIASRVDRTVIYIPIGQLSPVSLKRIRVVHVLDGYDKREIAKDYLW